VLSTVQEDREDVFAMPPQFRGKAVVRDRCSRSDVAPILPERVADWRAERAARLVGVRNLYDSVDCRQLGHGWQTVAPEEFERFDRWEPRDAAVAEATVTALGIDRNAVIDSWVHLRGVPFAVEAFARYCEIRWTVSRNGIVLQPGTVFSGPPGSWDMALRLLDLARSAPEDEYREALSVADRIRVSDPEGIRGAVAALLFPERPDWCDEAIAGHAARGGLPHGVVARMLFASVTTAEQVRAISRLTAWWVWTDDVRAEATLFAVGGGAAAGFLAHRGRAAEDRRYMSLLARMPGDEAVSILIEDVRQGRSGAQKAVLAAGQRFPRRTLRLLAEAAPDTRVAAVLRLQVQADPDLAAAEAPKFSEQARVCVEALLVPNVQTGPPIADPARLPSALVNPPWLITPTRTKPKVIKGLIPPEPTIAWLPGEREQWAADLPHWQRVYGEYTEQRLREAAAEVAAGGALPLDLGPFLAWAPAEVVLPLLATWQPTPRWLGFRAQAFLARFDLAVVPSILRWDQDARCKQERARVLLPVLTPDVAEFMARLSQQQSSRGNAEDWFRRHGDAAVRALVPGALARTGRARDEAGAALRLLADNGWSDPVAVTRQAHSPEAGEQVEALLKDRAGPAPKTMPALPPWAEPDALPPVLLADRHAALPSSALRVLVQMLSISKPGAPYPDLPAICGFCDSASLAEFAWALFEGWRLAAYPAGQSWVLTAQGLLGDDTTAERLVPLIRAWPGEGGHARAVAALDALAAIGSDGALAALHRLSLKGKFKALKTRAGERIAAVAAARGLDAEQLADRLVPDLGLDSNGTSTLDYGRRRFTVRFDEILRPSVYDASGNLVKALPKPGAQDDPVLAPDAYQRFGAMKKQLRTLAGDQLWRLEQAMCTRRRWSRAEFGDLLVAHPLMRHAARGLVWGVYEDSGLQAAFRIAEDLTYADPDDNRFAIPDGVLVGLVHSVELGESALSKWREVFGDYEILQPFAQLDRATFELTAVEAEDVTLKRFDGAIAPVERLAALERQGWRRGGAFIDGGTIPHCFRPLPDGSWLILPVSPGIYAADLLESGPQSLGPAWISASEHDYHQPPPHIATPASRIDPVTMSEIIRELTEATTQR
jgi:hypothetical protein